MESYDADPGRYGPAASAHPAGERDAARPGEHHVPEGTTAETVAQPVKVDNDSYVRDYSRCILCYKCVEACGEDAQNTFAIGVAGRGSTPGSPPSSTWACPTRPVSIAATASGCAPPAR
jgi:ferredoxin